MDEANRNGIYVGLLPTWGAWVVKNPRKDETIFTTAAAQKVSAQYQLYTARAQLLKALGKGD